MFAYAYTFITALAITFALTPLVRRLAIKIGAVDRPDARKVHHGLIPRLGGLAIYAGCLGSIALTVGFEDRQMLGLACGATFLIIVGVLDDRFSLPPKVKLFGQIFAAFILAGIFGVRIDWLDLPFVGYIYFPVVISVPLTVFWIIGFVNTVNLIDGLDGLAAGIAAIASLAVSFLAFQMGQWVCAAAMAAMAGSAIAFLQYNFNPAKIFMGDTGSMFLGYVIASVSVMGAMKTAAIAVLIAPLVALAVPILDTLMAIARRKHSGVPVFSPDKRHLHHRLLDKGLTQKQVVLVMYALTAFFSGMALLIIHLRPMAGVLICLAVLVIYLYWAKRLGVLTEGTGADAGPGAAEGKEGSA